MVSVPHDEWRTTTLHSGSGTIYVKCSNKITELNGKMYALSKGGKARFFKEFLAIAIYR